MKRSALLRVGIAILALFMSVSFASGSVFVAASAGPATSAATVPSSSPSAGTITMNFRDADIDSVLTFLSMAGGVTIVKDPSIAGKVTVIAPNKLTFDDALALLNSILKTRGATAIRTGSLVQVVPSDKAASISTVQVGADVADVPTGDQIVTQIIPLKKLKAADIQKQLAPLFASGAAIAADEQTNTLIITDFAPHIRRVLEIVNDLEQQQETIEAVRAKQTTQEAAGQKDKPGKLKDFLAAGAVDVKVVPLRYAPARQLADELSRILNAPQAQATIPQSLIGTIQKLAAADAKKVESLLRLLQSQSGTVLGGSLPGTSTTTPEVQGALVPNRVVADVYTNSLIVTGTADAIRIVGQLVAQLDQPQVATGPQYVTFVRPLQHADAGRMADTLNSLFAGFARQIPKQPFTQGTTVPGQALQESAGTLSGAAQDRLKKLLAATSLATPTAQGSPAGAGVWQLQLAQAPIALVADAATNSLIVTTVADVREQLESLIAELDKEDSGQVKVSFLYRLQFADATNLATVLNRFYSSGATSSRPDKNQRASAMSRPVSTKKKQDGSSDTAKAAKTPKTAKARTTAPNKKSLGSVTSGTPGVSYAADGVQVVADKDSNTLLIVAPAEMIEDVKATIAALDQPGSSDSYATRILPLTNAEATELAKTLTQLFAGSGRGAFPLNSLNLQGSVAQPPTSESASSGPPAPPSTTATEKEVRLDNSTRFVRVIAEPGTNSLVVIAPTEMMDDIDALVRRIDAQTPATALEYVTFVRPLQYADASRLANTLNSLFAGFSKQLQRQPGARTPATGAGSGKTSEGLLSTKSISQARPKAKAGPQLTETQKDAIKKFLAASNENVSISPGAGASVKTLQLQLAEAPVSVVADTWTNSLVITTAAEVKDQLESLIAELDKEGSDQVRVGFLYPLRSADATNLAAILNRYYASYTSYAGGVGSVGRVGSNLPAAKASATVSGENKAGSAKTAEKARAQSSDVRPASQLASQADVLMVADKDSNTLLVVAAVGLVDDVKATIAALDRPGSADTYATRVFALNNANAADLAKTLTQLFTGTGKNAFPLGSLGLQEVGSDTASAGSSVPAGSTPPAAPTAPADGAPADRQPPTLVDNAVRFIRIVAEPGTNSLVVVAPDTMMADIAALISRFDAQTPASDLRVVVYPLQFADSVALANTLTDFFAGAARISGQKGSTWLPLLSTPEARAAWQRLQGYVGLTPEPQSDRQKQVKGAAAPAGAAPGGAGIPTATASAGGAGGTALVLAQQVRAGQTAKTAPNSPGTVWVAAEPATNSLLIAAPADVISDVESLVKELDRESPVNSETGMTVYKLQNASAPVLADLMTSLFAAKPQPSNVSKPANALNSRNASRATNSTSQTGSTSSVRPNSSSQYGATNDAQAKFVPDLATNSLIITASPYLMGEIKAMLAKLDARPAQVLIEARVVEVSLDKNDAFGAEWSWLNSDSGASVTLGGNLGSILPGTDFKLSILSGDVQVALQALAQQAKLNVLSTPRILAVNNTPASIIIGDQVPYLQSTKKDPAGNEQKYYGYRDVGISLRVTPRIGESGNVYLDLEQQIDNLTKDVVAVNGAPIVATRQAQTSVVVKDGQTMVIGGLLRDNTSESVHKVPLLGDLPILGQLFQSKDTITQKTELLIFITPHVVRSEEQADALTIDVSTDAKK